MENDIDEGEGERAEAVRLYLECGWSIGALARSYGISRPGMRKRLVRWNVPLRTRGEQIRLDAAMRSRQSWQE